MKLVSRSRVSVLSRAMGAVARPLHSGQRLPSPLIHTRMYASRSYTNNSSTGAAVGSEVEVQLSIDSGIAKGRIVSKGKGGWWKVEMEDEGGRGIGRGREEVNVRTSQMRVTNSAQAQGLGVTSTTTPNALNNNNNKDKDKKRIVLEPLVVPVITPPALHLATSRWVVFSDLHVKDSSLQTCKEVLRQVHQAAQERDAGVIFLGDFWHVRGALNVQLLNEVMSELRSWNQNTLSTETETEMEKLNEKGQEQGRQLEERGKGKLKGKGKQTPVIMIPGNHDQVSLGGAVHSLQPLTYAFDPEQVLLISEPAVCMGALWLPYRRDEKLLARALLGTRFTDVTEGTKGTEGGDSATSNTSTDIMNSNVITADKKANSMGAEVGIDARPEASIVFCHADVRGARMNDNAVSRGGMDVRAFPPNVPVYSGHFHKPHTLEYTLGGEGIGGRGGGLQKHVTGTPVAAAGGGEERKIRLRYVGSPYQTSLAEAHQEKFLYCLSSSSSSLDPTTEDPKTLLAPSGQTQTQTQANKYHRWWAEEERWPVRVGKMHFKPTSMYDPALLRAAGMSSGADILEPLIEGTPLAKVVSGAADLSAMTSGDRVVVPVPRPFSSSVADRTHARSLLQALKERGIQVQMAWERRTVAEAVEVGSSALEVDVNAKAHQDKVGNSLSELSEMSPLEVFRTFMEASAPDLTSSAVNEQGDELGMGLGSGVEEGTVSLAAPGLEGSISSLSLSQITRERMEEVCREGTHIMATVLGGANNSVSVSTGDSGIGIEVDNLRVGSDFYTGLTDILTYKDAEYNGGASAAGDASKTSSKGKKSRTAVSGSGGSFFDLRLDSVHIKDFGPFGTSGTDLGPVLGKSPIGGGVLSYPLSKRGLVLLKGSSTDGTGADSNGAGKSTLAMSALWALSGGMDARMVSETSVGVGSGMGLGKGKGNGKSNGKTKKSKAPPAAASVAYGGREASVAVEGIINGKAFVVHRMRGAASADLRFSLAGEDLTCQAMRDTQRVIDATLGTGGGLLARTTFFGQHSHSSAPLLALPDQRFKHEVGSGLLSFAGMSDGSSTGAGAGTGPFALVAADIRARTTFWKGRARERDIELRLKEKELERQQGVWEERAAEREADKRAGSESLAALRVNLLEIEKSDAASGGGVGFTEINPNPEAGVLAGAGAGAGAEGKLTLSSVESLLEQILMLEAQKEPLVVQSRVYKEERDQQHARRQELLLKRAILSEQAGALGGRLSALKAYRGEIAVAGSGRRREARKHRDIFYRLLSKEDESGEGGEEGVEIDIKGREGDDNEDDDDDEEDEEDEEVEPIDLSAVQALYEMKAAELAELELSLRAARASLVALGVKVGGIEGKGEREEEEEEEGEEEREGERVVGEKGESSWNGDECGTCGSPLTEDVRERRVQELSADTMRWDKQRTRVSVRVSRVKQALAAGARVNDILTLQTTLEAQNEFRAEEDEAVVLRHRARTKADELVQLDRDIREVESSLGIGGTFNNGNNNNNNGDYYNTNRTGTEVPVSPIAPMASQSTIFSDKDVREIQEGGKLALLESQLQQLRQDLREAERQEERERGKREERESRRLSLQQEITREQTRQERILLEHEQRMERMRVGKDEIDTLKGDISLISDRKLPLLSSLQEAFGPRGVQNFVFSSALSRLEDSANAFLHVLTDGGIKLNLKSDASTGDELAGAEDVGEGPASVGGRIVKSVFVRVEDPARPLLEELDPLSHNMTTASLNDRKWGPLDSRSTYTERSLAQLSGGQWRRVSLALDLAFADCVRRQGRLRSNVLVLDEVLTHMDRAGRARVGTVLKALAGPSSFTPTAAEAEVRAQAEEIGEGEGAGVSVASTTAATVQRNVDSAADMGELESLLAGSGTYETILVILQDLAALELEESFDHIDVVRRGEACSTVVLDDGKE